MSIFHLRFVGAVELPKSLSQMDVDESFRLSQKDIAGNSPANTVLDASCPTTRQRQAVTSVMC